MVCITSSSAGFTTKPPVAVLTLTTKRMGVVRALSALGPGSALTGPRPGASVPLFSWV